MYWVQDFYSTIALYATRYTAVFIQLSEDKMTMYTPSMQSTNCAKITVH